MGRSVDRLSDRFGPGSTGLVQAALGNLPELFFGIFGLRAGLVGVVQSALVGSILANVLLILGAAFVVGGLRHGTQRFAVTGARSVALLLLLAVAILSVPGISAHLHVAVAKHETALSTAASVVLLIIFVLSIPATVKDHLPSPTTEIGGPRWPLGLVLAVLGVSSVAAAFVSDWFVTALTPALSVLHMSQAFAGLVVVAIAGNAVENVVGVQLAAKNKPDYAMEVILRGPVVIVFAAHAAVGPRVAAVGGSAAYPGAPVRVVGRPGELGGHHRRGCLRRGVDVARGLLPRRPLPVIATSFWWG